MAFKDKFKDFRQLNVNDSLVLRQIRPEQDFSEYAKIYYDADAFRYYEGYSTLRDDEQLKAVLQNQIKAFEKMREYNWTIAYSNTDRALGRILLSDFQKYNTAANIGYFLNREFWGKGIISACIAPVVKFGFDYLNLTRIFTTVEPNNFASWKALEKNGFAREGTMRSAVLLPDGLHDCYLYAVIKN
jgi:ribosomal-protein-alanine N-acetyltransferase